MIRGALVQALAALILVLEAALEQARDFVDQEAPHGLSRGRSVVGVGFHKRTYNKRAYDVNRGI